MSIKRSPVRFGRLAALPLLLLGLAACGNPVEHEEHPEGLVVLDASGTEVARYMVDVGTATGDLNVGVDGSTTFTVRAVSDDGDEIAIDGEELSIQVGSTRPGFTAEVSGTNRVVVTATAAGISPLTITLFHGDHPEFVATFQVVAT